MPGLARIAGFVALLAAVFVGALVLGDAIGPEPSDDQPRAEGHVAEHGAGDEQDSAGPAAPVPRGLAHRAEGVQLDVSRTRFAPGRRADFAFRIVDGSGAPVRDFEIEHERRMHLIVVRRDMAGYQHLHPRQAGDGTWHVPLRLAEPGTYRVFADFKRGGGAVTLGTDVEAAGTYAPGPLPAPSEVARTDGYEVALHADGGQVEFDVTRDGRPITDIAPYLGARGHLVALREEDLAYLHVHPDEDRLAFAVEYPSAATYRLFLQFKHDGRVHTAEFTQEADDASDH